MSLKAFKDYLLLEKKYSVHTAIAYINDLDALQFFLDTNYNSDKIEDVEYTIIRQWVVNLVNEGISNRSINRKMSSLNSYYKFLVVRFPKTNWMYFLF